MPVEVELTEAAWKIVLLFFVSAFIPPWSDLKWVLNHPERIYNALYNLAEVV